LDIDSYAITAGRLPEPFWQPAHENGVRPDKRLRDAILGAGMSLCFAAPARMRAKIASLFAMAAIASSSIAGTPTRGTLYMSSFTGQSIHRVDYTYDGAQTLTVDAVKMVASGVHTSYGLAFTPDHRLIAVSAGILQRVNPNSGLSSAVNTVDNANTAAIDPDGQMAWVGWKDTSLSSVPLQPLANGTPHGVSGDDGVATEIAFTPANGVFYTTGGEDRLGNVGSIDLSTFKTKRLFGALNATGIKYDPFSQTIIVAAFGRAHQFDPAAPGALLSSRDDSATGDSYIDVVPDGYGHYLSTSSSNTASWISIVDYSASGRIGDASSVRATAIVPSVAHSTIAAIDASLFRDDFEP
jgi:hypothetical protein